MVSYIQPPPDSTGKKIEIDRIQNFDGGDTYRQRFADGSIVEIDGEFAKLMLIEMKVLNHLMARVDAALNPMMPPLSLEDLRYAVASDTTIS